jgi:hypothetical protein
LDVTLWEKSLKFGCQTDSTGLVVSNQAVFYRNFHLRTSSALADLLPKFISTADYDSMRPENYFTVPGVRRPVPCSLLLRVTGLRRTINPLQAAGMLLH